MPSPFPGMDPYLEAPDIWPDFHDRLAEHISAQLNRSLPQTYYARLEMRPEIGVVGGDPVRRIVPDVSVQQDANSFGQHSVAVLDGPRTELSESITIDIPAEPIRHHFVEVRDSQRGHILVTLIEIVSPSNKSAGGDRLAYEKKQREVLSSDASLIEIDLLRTGTPIAGGDYVIEEVARFDPAPDYLVVVSRAWKRGVDLGTQLFPTFIRNPLPCIPVPLRESEDEVPLDLQYVFGLTYDSGPYQRGAVDYSQPPTPRLTSDLTDWSNQLLLAKGLVE